MANGSIHWWHLMDSWCGSRMNNLLFLLYFVFGGDFLAKTYYSLQINLYFPLLGGYIQLTLSKWMSTFEQNDLNEEEHSVGMNREEVIENILPRVGNLDWLGNCRAQWLTNMKHIMQLPCLFHCIFTCISSLIEHCLHTYGNYFYGVLVFVSGQRMIWETVVLIG